MSVGVMKDDKLKLRNLRASYTHRVDYYYCLLRIDKARAKDKKYI